MKQTIGPSYSSNPQYEVGFQEKFLKTNFKIQNSPINILKDSFQTILKTDISEQIY